MTVSIARSASILSAATALLVAAIAGPNSAPSAEEFFVQVRSIDEIAAGAMPAVADITASEGVLQFESSVPLACSVVYGESPDFGRVATDLDMNGGAHSDHHPILSGLKPNTEYFFRVQGTATDGTLYVGEVQTFRTLRQVTGGPVNLASLAAGARVIGISSNFGGATNDGPWGGNSAIDGSRSTAWSSSGDGDGAFIQVELADRAEVKQVEVWTRSMSDGTAQILRFTLTTDRGHVLGPFALPDASQPYRFDVDVVARSLRLDVLESSGGNVGLIEFRAYSR